GCTEILIEIFEVKSSDHSKRWRYGEIHWITDRDNRRSELKFVGISSAKPRRTPRDLKDCDAAACIGNQTLRGIATRAEFHDDIPRFPSDFIRGEYRSVRIDKKAGSREAAMLIFGLDPHDRVFGLVENPFNFGRNGSQALLRQESGCAKKQKY